MSYWSATGRGTSRPVFAGIGARLLTVLEWFEQAGRAFHGRRMIADLGRLDDRMLRDIGLSRSDLRDAASVSRLKDPTIVLFRRAAERRSAREGRSDAGRAADTSGRGERKRFVPYY